MRFFIALTSFFLLLKVSVWPVLFEGDIQAKSVILINAENGKVLYEKNARKPFYPASLTKMATALYVLEMSSDLDHPLKVHSETIKRVTALTKEAQQYEPAYLLETDGSTMGLKRGETLSLRSLLYGIMLISGNDAANVIAEGVSGSIPDFMAELNNYLHSFGCTDTYFCNPHGLHHPKHITTAFDLALMLQRGLLDQQFREMISTLNYVVPATTGHAERELQLTNRLMKTGPYYDRRAIGGKTGYTSAAGNCLAIAAEEEGRSVIAILLGCDNRNIRYSEARKLFDAAFSEEKVKREYLPAGQSYTYQLEGARAPLYAGLKDGVSLEFYPSEEEEVRAFLHWDDLELPVSEGQRVGEVRLISCENQKVLKKAPIFAKEEVKKTFFAYLKSFFS